MPTPGEAKNKAAATYNAASDFYDHAANAFWERFGRGTVSRLALRPGSRVLDVCCGSGASAIPAAQAVGPEGSVLAVDLAKDLLDLAGLKAARRGLANIEFRLGDMLDLGLPDSSFDAVICVFGIFFVPDMPAAVRELWRLVKPGGQLAITTWAPDLFEPLNTVFWDAVRAERPDLYKGFNPWDRLGEPDKLRDMLKEGGVDVVDIAMERGTQPITSAEDAMAVIMGTGYRATYEQLDEKGKQSVRAAVDAQVESFQTRGLETSALYARAEKR